MNNSLLTSKERRRALALALDLSRDGLGPARRAQSRRELLNNTVCVRVGGAWVYEMPSGNTATDPDMVVTAWAQVAAGEAR
jgi:hypothetical protein